MRCPAENTWTDYVGGHLEVTAIAALDGHLDGCSSCRLLYAQLAQCDDALAATAVERPLARHAEAEHARGTEIGRYIIVSELGRGGMGVVYKAFDPELDRSIALKLVRFDGLDAAQAESMRLRLLREAQTLARLSHPNVVSVYDVGTVDAFLFVAMELVAGKTLRAWLDDGPRSPREVLGVFAAAGAGLAAAHELGIVHRDFKPENVMVADDGSVRVLDFGLARSPDAAPGRPSLPQLARPVDPELTAVGTVMGTPAYMAPEQDAGGTVDARSDQFSFCTALYEALYQCRPFAGDSYPELAASRASGSVAAPPAVRGVSARVRSALFKGLRVNPADRHPDMRALLAALRGPTGRTSVRVAIGGLAVVAAVAAGFAVWTARHAPKSVEATCAETAREVDRVWNPKRRATMIAKLTASGVPDAAPTASRLAADVDRWTVAWAHERADVCAVTMAGGTRADAQVADQLQCLERTLSELDDEVAIASLARPELVPTMSGWTLREPTSCKGAAPPQVTPASEPVVRTILDAVQAQRRGELAKAVETATSAVQLAREGHLPMEARAVEVLGELQLSAGQVDASVQTLHDAILVGTRVKDEEAVADAWLNLISTSFLASRFDERTEAAIFGAKAAVMQLPPDNKRHADLLYREGTARVLQGDLVAATTQLEASLDAWKQLSGKSHETETAFSEHSLALVDMLRGNFARAHTLFDHALEVWSKIGSAPNTVNSLDGLGDLLELEGRHAEAESTYLRAIDVVSSISGEHTMLTGNAELSLAIHHAFVARCADALTELDLAEKPIAAAYGAESSRAGWLAFGRGLCALERGHTSQAIEHLTHALALVNHGGGSPPTPPMTRIVLAAAYRCRGDVARAHQLEADAAPALSTMPTVRGLLDKLAPAYSCHAIAAAAP
jgi:tetratricopeptide (TPR) repeat protein